LCAPAPHLDDAFAAEHLERRAAQQRVQGLDQLGLAGPADLGVGASPVPRDGHLLPFDERPREAVGEPLHQVGDAVARGRVRGLEALPRAARVAMERAVLGDERDGQRAEPRLEGRRVAAAHEDDVGAGRRGEPAEQRAQRRVGRRRRGVAGERDEGAVVVEEHEAAARGAERREEPRAVARAEVALGQRAAGRAGAREALELLVAPAHHVVAPQAARMLRLRALDVEGHLERPLDPSAMPLDVVRVHEHRLAQFARGAGGVRQHEHAGVVRARPGTPSPRGSCRRAAA
jgi:hypothetical protein